MLLHRQAGDRREHVNPGSTGLINMGGGRVKGNCSYRRRYLLSGAQDLEENSFQDVIGVEEQEQLTESSIIVSRVERVNWKRVGVQK